MKTKLRLLGAMPALFLLAAAIAPSMAPAQEVRQALADTFDVVRQASYWNDFDGTFNPVPAEDVWCGDEQCCDCYAGRPLNMWAQFEYLMWWGKGSHVPPLVTSSVPSNVPRPQAGVLGFPTTRVLFGNELVGDEVQSGVRSDIGIWLDGCHNTGVGVRTYGLEGDDANFFAASTGDPILARPFFNALLLQEDALLIAYTDPVNGPVAEGNINVNYHTSFVGNDVYLRMMMERCPTNRVDLIAGYTYMRLADRLDIRSFHTSLEPLVTGTTFDIRDQFATSNVFHGGAIGLMGTRARDRWSIDWLGKLNLGANRQRVRIAGSTVVTPPLGAGVNLPGGLLAQQTNIGDYERSTFALVPEMTINLNYHLNSNISIGIGYNLIFWDAVVTAGPEIDRQVNLTQLTGPLIGPARPAFPGFVEDDYWLQGLQFSLRAEY